MSKYHRNNVTIHVRDHTSPVYQAGDHDSPRYLRLRHEAEEFRADCKSAVLSVLGCLALVVIIFTAFFLASINQAS